jgi:hypothetical protein
VSRFFPILYRFPIYGNYIPTHNSQINWSQLLYGKNALIITLRKFSFSIPLFSVAPSEAFEIPIAEVDEDKQSSLIKKHPPKRLKRLEELQPQPPTIEGLEEKLATGELKTFDSSLKSG